MKESKIKLKDGSTKSFITIELDTEETASKIRAHFNNLKAEESNKIIEFIPNPASDRRKKYENYAYCLRQEGYNTKIQTSKHDYLILAKMKSDTTPWSKTSPMLPPDYDKLPLFKVGKLSEETEKTIRTKEAERNNKKIEDIKKENQKNRIN